MATSLDLHTCDHWKRWRRRGVSLHPRAPIASSSTPNDRLQNHRSLKLTTDGVTKPSRTADHNHHNSDQAVQQTNSGPLIGTRGRSRIPTVQVLSGYLPHLPGLPLMRSQRVEVAGITASRSRTERTVLAGYDLPLVGLCTYFLAISVPEGEHGHGIRSRREVYQDLKNRNGRSSNRVTEPL